MEENPKSSEEISRCGGQKVHSGLAVIGTQEDCCIGTDVPLKSRASDGMSTSGADLTTTPTNQESSIFGQRPENLASLADSLSECEAYNSETENDKARSNDQENDLRTFMVQSAAWSKVRRRFKSMGTQRDINSDGTVLNMPFCTDATENSSRHFRFLLNRSLSAPPSISSEAMQEQEVRMGSFSDAPQYKAGSAKDRSGNNESIRESSKDSCSSKIEESASPSRRSAERDIQKSSEKTKLCSAPTCESESSTLASGDIKEGRNEIEEPSIACTKSKTPSSDVTGVYFSPFDVKATTPEISSISESSCNPNYSGVPCLGYGAKANYPSRSVLALAVSYSEKLENAATASAGVQNAAGSSEETCTAGPSNQESPPKLTSEPPSTPGFVQVPEKLSKFKTPEVLDLLGPSNSDDDNNSPGSGGRKRPTDFNVKPRSSFYSFCSSSPTGLTMRSYRSLPNVNRPPAKNIDRRSINLDNRARSVVRSLFIGNFNWRRYTPGSGVSSASKEILSLERRPSSEELPSCSSRESVSKDKIKVCKKLVFTSPPPKETDANQTAQDHCSSEIIGEGSSTHLNEVAYPQDATPKRKEDSSFPTEKFSVKKPRSSVDFGPSGVDEKLTGAKNVELAKFPSSRSTRESSSPKRKVEDVEIDRNPERAIAVFASPESTLKRTKMEPSPTPVDELDKQNMQEPEEEIGAK